MDTDSAKLTWQLIEPLQMSDSSNIYCALEQLSLEVACVCQSSCNIYYQSDKSLLTALQICLMFADLNSMIPMSDISSPISDDSVRFQLFNRESKR